MTGSTPGITPAQFVEKWERTQLGERASYQEHFTDVCRLVGHPTPAEKDPTGEEMTFEYGVKKLGGQQGYADVFYRRHFAIEYKAKGKYDSLDEAYKQLLQYRENLQNPPLLIVCDVDNWEVHTNWPNTEKKVYSFKNSDITRPYYQRLLHNLFFEPNALHPDRTAEQVTGDAADVFKQIAENMRAWEASPERIAHFLTKLVFCLFAEDVGLLPPTSSGKGIFTEIVERSREKPTRLTRYLRELFERMRDGGEMHYVDIPYFDGRLFDNVDVEDLSLEALTALERACQLDWSSIEPVIFGTLFERSLDPSKRAQLGAHYTSRDDILLIVEPVLMQPLRREWERIKAEAQPIYEAYQEAVREKNRRKQQNRLHELETLREQMLTQLRTITVLDPACGSGNFLYVSLGLLLDLEKEVINHEVWADLPRPFPEVHPRQLNGIEINPIAHDLASIVVWIGFIQWRQNNGYLTFSEPILEPLDNIELKDAILGVNENGTLYDPEWPSVDVIVSNPPFLGSIDFPKHFGEEYTRRLGMLYDGRIPNNTDLVAYWFEKARDMLISSSSLRVGLVATSRINQVQNRVVLERIKEVGDFFSVVREKPWHDGKTAVRVSFVCFDNGSEKFRSLDGRFVKEININLTSGFDITLAKHINERPSVVAMGTKKYGPFELTEVEAKRMLSELNPSGLSNRLVVRRWANGQDVARGRIDKWIIDFHHNGDKTLEEASQFIAPFEYVKNNVRPTRINQRNKRLEEEWWLYEAPRHELRNTIKQLRRYLVTVYNGSRRYFVWLDARILPDQQLVVFATEDDYVMGVLHSMFHTLWSLEAGGKLGRGNTPRYTITAVIDTFPFPWPPGQEDTNHPAYKAISKAAKQLHEERDAWLNPPGVTSEKALKNRTLTNLYNALNVWRGVETIKVTPEAADFAPRLDELHQALDRAVCDAYGWPHEVLADEEEILRRLLALNWDRTPTN